jgi:hypothetical protein
MWKKILNVTPVPSSFEWAAMMPQSYCIDVTNATPENGSIFGRSVFYFVSQYRNIVKDLNLQNRRENRCAEDIKMTLSWFAFQHRCEPGPSDNERVVSIPKASTKEHSNSNGRAVHGYDTEMMEF